MTNLKEDGAAYASTTPANAAGSGGVEGIGVGPRGEPGVDLKKKKKLRDITLMTTPIKRLVPNGLDR
ncbi:hypothetical protein UFOVP1071_98 [uncultured Caudovirales phage]|jgi:hypothetical protein|uniref:Uncharacterized protein n=1 Tax=uncultured Caudovirales phage TaxID=2100421 RepID=A0A6J5QQW8_9CAUD|nr:hypothetical protein UFOVP1071_98 [uncultured Caudovirales phage]